jgi:hypothetical protein
LGPGRFWGIAMPAMTANLAALVELVALPPRPLRCADEGNWTRLRAEIGFRFPAEFLQYGRLYGTGEIDAEGYGMLIANPLDSAYSGWIRSQSEVMRTRGDPPELRRTRFYPEKGGVVPFAKTWSGNLLFFRSHGRSVRVVTCPTGDPSELVTYAHGFAGFLVTLFTGKLKPESFFPNRELRKRKPVFTKRVWLQ